MSGLPEWVNPMWDDIKAAVDEAPDEWWGEALGFGLPPKREVESVWGDMRDWRLLLDGEPNSALRAHLVVWWWMRSGDRSVTPGAGTVDAFGRAFSSPDES